LITRQNSTYTRSDEGRGHEKKNVTSTCWLYLAGTIQRYNKVPPQEGTEKKLAGKTQTILPRREVF
jgi:hypothetical protein